MKSAKIEDRLIFLISRVYTRCMITLKKLLQQEGLNVTPKQVMLLHYLQNNNGCSLTELSRGVMLENSTITGLINRLEKSGYVERRNDPKDRRTYCIYFTDKGRLVASRSLPIIKKINEMIKEGYSEKEIEAFKKVMLGAFNKFK